jgi:hypothetical protein
VRRYGVFAGRGEDKVKVFYFPDRNIHSYSILFILKIKILQICIICTIWFIGYVDPEGLWVHISKLDICRGARWILFYGSFKWQHTVFFEMLYIVNEQLTFLFFKWWSITCVHTHILINTNFWTWFLTYEVCSKSFWNLSINNIFLCLELIEYYPLKIISLAQQCISPTAFYTFGSTVWRMFGYRLQVICRISDEVLHCLKSSSFKGILGLGNKKNVGGERSGELVRLWKGRNWMFCLIDNTVWADTLSWWRRHLSIIHISGLFLRTASCRCRRTAS